MLFSACFFLFFSDDGGVGVREKKTNDRPFVNVLKYLVFQMTFKAENKCDGTLTHIYELRLPQNTHSMFRIIDTINLNAKYKFLHFFRI